MGKKNKQKRKAKENNHDESEQLNEDQELSQNEDQEPAEEPEPELPLKRDHDDDDSDAENKPRRKKKKNKQKRKDKENKHDESEQLNEDQELSQNEDQEPAEEPEPELPLKRDHDDDDSDAEDKPRRKKKKKSIVPADSTGPKKGAKSIRQMKREKFAARQAAAQVEAKDQHKTECLNYLSQWKHNRQNWKFMKAKQVWLFKNKFSTTLVPDASWPTLLEYFDSAQGNIRNMLLADANKIIKQLDDWSETQNKENNDEEAEESESEITKPDDNVYKRARDLIQCLGE